MIKRATEKMIMFRLFLVAFAPLMCIVAIQTSDDWNAKGASTWVFRSAALLSVIGFIDGWRLPRGSLRTGSTKATVHDIQDQSGAVAAYLATYLLPFIGIEFTAKEIFSLLIFIIVILAIFMQSDLVAINPTFYLFSQRIVRARIKYPNSSDMVMVTLIYKKGQLQLNKTINVVELGKVLVLKEVR